APLRAAPCKRGIDSLETRAATAGCKLCAAQCCRAVILLDCRSCIGRARIAGKMKMCLRNLSRRQRTGARPEPAAPRIARKRMEQTEIRMLEMTGELEGPRCHRMRRRQRALQLDAHRSAGGRDAIGRECPTVIGAVPRQLRPYREGHAAE